MTATTATSFECVVFTLAGFAQHQFLHFPPKNISLAWSAFLSGQPCMCHVSIHIPAGIPQCVCGLQQLSLLECFVFAPQKRSFKASDHHTIFFSEYFTDILNYHCIIYQQALCGKIWIIKEVMNVAMKIVCFVRARNLQRMLSCAQLEETGADQTNLLLHTDMRWLSTGTFLARFTELLSEIKYFLNLSKYTEYPQLEDFQWLLDLIFLIIWI